MGENNPYYFDTLELPELIGVFKGACPCIYHETQDNHQTMIPSYNTIDHCHILCNIWMTFIL